jgi:L-threonylcarbamoyladenylate synthase
MKSLQLFWQDESTIARLSKALKDGDVVAGTSDTVLGLLADTTQEGFLALNAIKGRHDKPYLVLIASVDKVNHFAQFPLSPDVQKLMAACWPGPLTLVLPAKKELAPWLAPSGTIALRVPQHAGLLELLPHFEGLYSTSANLAGKPVPKTLNELDALIRENVAYVVDDKEGKNTVVPSTIIDCTRPQLKIIREGTYSIADLKKIIKHKIE